MEDLKGLIAANLWLIWIIVIVFASTNIMSIVGLAKISRKLKTLNDQLKINYQQIKKAYINDLENNFLIAFDFFVEAIAKEGIKNRKDKSLLMLGEALGKIRQKSTSYFGDPKKDIANDNSPKKLLDSLVSLCEKGSPLMEKITAFEIVFEKTFPDQLINRGDEILDLRIYEERVRNKIKELENFIKSLTEKQGE